MEQEEILLQTDKKWEQAIKQNSELLQDNHELSKRLEFAE